MIEPNNIYLGDCLELMKQMPDKSVDLVMTDPPYGIGRDKGFEGFEGFGGFGAPIARTRYTGNWDSQKLEKVYFDEMLRVGKNMIMFGGNFYTDKLPQGNHWIVWNKYNTMPTFGDCELIWTNIKRNSVKLYNREWNGLLGKEKERHHATQKPLDLIVDLLVDYSNENDLILDPFLGSGTTAVACIKTNRRYIGMEIDPTYIEIAKKRIELEKQQMKLELV
ncbi:MAG: site-specific DNA-methyltransferase [Candidatus Marinimicrobia bacterium]|nr:site-specific DNA-methyltransferase [Candidatus Neomarinimicrobiota bacterium]